MKLGILGGSFDPIHLGHLRAAENARDALGLDRVLFVPAGQPPHKTGATLAPAGDRFAMVALATAGHPAFVPSDRELVRPGASYTVDTLEELRRERPSDDLVLLVGSDTLAEMSSWREPERIFALCAVAVFERPGSPRGEPPRGARVLEVKGQGLLLSASSVRALLREGKSVRYLVPEPVADFIAKRGLYR
jgi:nicotinate-nucleotide adenylyltransferase